MYNIILTIHLILIFALCAVVLIQRSEGGGLGMGGGGGNALGGRSKANPLSTVTWVLAVAFIGTSLLLTMISANEARSRGVLDGIVSEQPTDDPAVILPSDLTGDALLPPSSTDEPVAPPAAE